MRWIPRDVIAAGCLLLQAVATPQVPRPTFRPHVVVVPIDVRVFDKTGHPIDDLRESDFQVFEDGKRRDISLFSHEIGSGATGLAPSGIASSAGVSISPAEPRTFLLVLGRGRLEGPSKGLTALIDFVRTQLTPEDRVGVAAYNRISDLTTDHEAVARLLIRYKDKHEAIENVLSNYLRGLAAVLWDGVSILPSIQSQIDHLFQSPGLPRLRRMPMQFGPDDEGFGDIRREVLDMFAADLRSLVTPELVRGHQDLQQLFTCTEFLRAVSGEKHLIFVTEQPPNSSSFWPREDKLALLASDARIAVSTIQTGGLPANFRIVPRGLLDATAPITPYVEINSDNPFPGRTLDEALSIQAIRGAAQQTGGVFSAYEPGATAVRRIAERTASRYTLGYYPPESTATGTFHNIEVKVARSGVDLSYRRGYFASDIAAFKDLRATISAERVKATFEDYRAFTDIPIDLTVRAVGSRVDVSLKIDPKAIQFTEHDGGKTAALEIAVAVGRSGKDARGQKQDAIDLSFDPPAFKRLTREKIAYTTSVDVTGDPRKLEVKVVVYDYTADRVGTAVARIR